MALCGSPVPPPPTYPPDNGDGPPSQWVQLCDDNGPFRRRYDYDADGNPAGHADYTLDGEPYEPVGDVRDCAADECPSPTEPLATTGLCLADGTPIAVVSTRNCDGVVSSDGWINLTTGAYTAGPPPAGTMSCSSARSIEVSGTFCDIDENGDVVGLVLVEYQYDENGAVSAVRLVDATTGDTYEPQGEITVCPAGVEQPENDLVELCDVTADGTVTRFLRDYRRDENNTIVGHADYTLDHQPYTVTGTVTSCMGEPVVCEPGSTTDGTYTTGVVEVAPELATGTPLPADRHEVPGMGDLATGGTYVIEPTNCGVSSSGQDAGTGAVQLPTVSRPECDDGTATVRVSVHYRQDGPDAGQAGTGDMSVYYHDTDGGVVLAGRASLPNGAPVGAEGDLVVDAEIPADRVAAGDVFVTIAAETWQKSWNQPPKCKGWTFSAWSASYAYDTTGCEPQAPQLAQRVQLCTSDDNPIPVEIKPGIDTELVVLCDIAEDGTSTPFLRAVQTDAGTGEQKVIADTTLDGEPYDVAGEVGTCAPEPCQHCETLVLCDTTPGEGGEPPTTYEAIPLAELPAGPTSGTTESGVAWSVNCGEWLEPQGHYTIYPIGGGGSPQCVQRWEFDQPVFLRFGLRGFNVNPRECIEYRTDADVLVEYLHPNHREGDDPPNSVCGIGSATDETILATAEPVTWLELEAITNAGQGRGPGLIEIAVPDEAPPGEGTQRAFLRTICRDCSTDVTTTVDTELDGITPYTPAGEVTVCGPNPDTGEPVERFEVETTLLCVTDDVTGERVQHVRAEYVYDISTGGLSETRYVDPGTGEPVEIAEGTSVGPCERCEQTTSLLRLCDLNPDTPPDSDGKICAVPFLRHLVHDCDGNVVDHHDTEPDGTTPYTPVQVVDCTTHTPALVEVPWVTVSVEEDPNGPEHQAFIFRISPVDDPDTVGTVRVQTSRQAGGACGDYDLDRLLFSNTAGYTITLDEVAQSVSSFKVNLIDFDWFEPVQITGPMPTRLGGTAVWNDAGNRIVPTEDNGTGEMYWDQPPPEIAYTIWNTGGGNSCSQLSFEAITFKPEGCCTCDTTNGDEPSLDLRCREHILCDTGPDGDDPVSFMRTICRDSNGNVVSVTDTELDATTPYTVRT